MEDIKRYLERLNSHNLMVEKKTSDLLSKGNKTDKITLSFISDQIKFNEKIIYILKKIARMKNIKSFPMPEPPKIPDTINDEMPPPSTPFEMPPQIPIDVNKQPYGGKGKGKKPGLN